MQRNSLFLYIDLKFDSAFQLNCLFLHGPPGIGKTSLANIILSENGFDVCDFNASEVRNQKQIKEQINEINGNVNVLDFMNSDLSIAVTGIAGPGGGSKNKPVGLVHIGIGTKKNIVTKRYLFKGNRLKVRQETTLEALKLSNESIENFKS